MKKRAQSLIEIALIAVFAAVIGYAGWSMLGGNIQSLLNPSMVTSDANTGRAVGTNNVQAVNNDLNTLSNSKNSKLINLVNTIKSTLNIAKPTSGIETSGAMAKFLADNDISSFAPAEQAALTDLQKTLPQATSDLINISNQLAALVNKDLAIGDSTSAADKYNNIVAVYQAANTYTGENAEQVKALLTQLQVQLANNSAK